MDTIFRNTRSIFSVVRVAREQPRRYGKNGELLVEYAVTEERLRRLSRSSGSFCQPDYFYTCSVLLATCTLWCFCILSSLCPLQAMEALPKRKIQFITAI